MREDQELRSLKRGLRVLALLNQTETIAITQLARQLGFPRTTAERILLTLVAEGYVQRVPDEKRYRLSAKVCALAGGFSEDCRVIETASPLLFKITATIGWPLAIATPSGDRMVLRATTDPATSLWLNRRRVGAEIPVLNASSGLVALAFASSAEQDALLQVLRVSSDSFNRERSATRQALDLLLQPVRENGFAFQPPPNNNPEHSISFPLFVGGRYVASLLMIYMTRAMSSATVIERYVPQLRELAHQISTATTAREEIDLESAAASIPWVPQMGFAQSSAFAAASA
jgi:IclR family mhp operon transcriptional activator